MAGLIVSVLGCLMAVAIWYNQHVQSKQLEKLIEEVHATVVDRDKLLCAVEADGDTQVTGEDDLSDFADGGIDVLEGKYRFWSQKDVPLGVIHRAVGAWIESGNSGDWPIGSVVGAARQRGKGNHSWYLAFVDPTDKRQRHFRLSKGGQGKSGYSITEVVDLPPSIPLRAAS